MEAGHRRGSDARPRDHAEGRRGSDAGSHRRRGDRDAGRARSHQEGQEGRSRRREKRERGEEEVKLIVGLGNPGSKYRGTRHNVGFDVIDEVARRAAVTFESAPADALMARWRDRDTIVAKPLTFVNNSGQAIGELLRYFKIDAADLLVIVDEAQLPLGKLRARARGSAGGHNGLKSVIAHLGDDFARLRLGVGRGPEGPEGKARRDLADHVLSRFDADERAEADRMITRSADAAEMFITSGIAAVMNQYNGGDPATTE
ncbi:MAG: aminoacyl-tRNA hydrolase [Acidobacteria bacterium]|nr:MAG: aminoacyl-tRNA hydrolase [Acidobacteriota bacterium]PYQ86566.1 MAG: aminoacyl-tRNA hydrolase [Acidobacteriota bacterium]